ncbi:hypothetical protein Clacol_000801 [Clathrus columnatus]|uniref:Uncharacterized protein n=1 Tax=Clathrus columnatus TaxID=1419009 RepID=A0AAV5A087_9AGAM|nr:hypothetical protein Clacol_000801 [Clathrus columnatus]
MVVGYRDYDILKLKKNNLEIENQKLKEQLASALNQQSEEQHHWHRRIQLPEIEEEDLCSEVLSIANKFMYMSLLWLEQPDITFEMELDDEYDPHD